MSYPTTLATPLNNVSSKIGVAGYTAGSGSIVLQSGGGAQFPPPTSPNYYRVTVIQAALAYSPTASSSSYTIFPVTSVSSDTLTIGLPLDGTSDRNYVQGDVVEIRETAGTISDIHTRIVDDFAMNLEVYLLAGGL